MSSKHNDTHDQLFNRIFIDLFFFLMYNLKMQMICVSKQLFILTKILRMVFMKLTKKRKEILEIILKSQKPITAKFLKSEVSSDLSTIYRSLDFLSRNRLIFSFGYENEKYYFKDENISIFICDSCKIMENISDLNNKSENEHEKLEKKGFFLTFKMSISTGHCVDCNKKEIFRR